MDPLHLCIILSLFIHFCPCSAYSKQHKIIENERSEVKRTSRLAKAQLMMDEVNRKATTWKAELNEPFALMDDAEVRGLVRIDDEEEATLPGVPHQTGGTDTYDIRPKALRTEEPELRYFSQVDPLTFKVISTSGAGVTCADYRFDIRQKWPQCAEIIGKIRDQSQCLSCYAVAGAAAFSDRHCIAKVRQGKAAPPANWDNSYFSAADIMQCARAGGRDACQGGWSFKVWRFLNEHGLVSGHGYQQGGCKPYPFPSLLESKKILSTGEFEYAGECEQSCSNANYWNLYKNDKVKTTNWHTLGLEMGWEQVIKEEIFTNGTVPVDIVAYDNFVRFYTGGIYHHVPVANEFGGGHIVRLIGYGKVNCTDGRSTKYWLVANSWNTTWGEDGFFRIQRGVNEVGIESRDISFGAIQL